MHRRTFLLGGLLWSSFLRAQPPALMLANRYHADIVLADYWVSEKFDGVRAYWDGGRFISRGGHPIDAPDWFTRHLPATPLDGELWAGHQAFSQLMSALQRATPDDAPWRSIRYLVFDLPGLAQPFGNRLARLREQLPQPASAPLRLVEQIRLDTAAELHNRLRQVVAAGGEGLMLHRDAAPYRSGRSDDLLKLKPYDDDDARVLGHLPGKGKHQGRLGALLVETSDGRRFRLGSGFSDAERANPPPLGSTVTYRYYGTTALGLPRFASYLRIRGLE